jgi:hypothetical protein
MALGSTDALIRTVAHDATRLTGGLLDVQEYPITPGRPSQAAFPFAKEMSEVLSVVSY